MTAPAPADGEIAAAMQVWPLPDAVAVGETFALNVGVKSAAGHKLSGGTIEVRDGSGSVVASATLNAARWPQSSALYWAELILTAPPHPRLCTWSACFTAPADIEPHVRVSHDICLALTAPPAYTLKVTVLDKVTATPIDTAVVRWGAYRASTDARGQAELKVPEGAHDLIVWKAGFAAPANRVVIHTDVDVVIAVVSVPEDDPDSVWKM